ncbi:hypothetical protein COT72_03045 [archaeon CG10_big_fil_rev_8_21_14_0_10_43_11]|nr:MAG: hypothetical protein COT72_03045 [archaeon CG10_big_fil_rev_8_21_14_0_10_43_11]
MGGLMGIFNLFKKRSKSAEKEKIKEETLDLSKISTPRLGETIDSWQKQVSILEEHPLSQARVVNTQILESMGSVMSGIHSKLDDLKKLDEILEALEALKTEKSTQITEKEPKSVLESALERIGHLSVKDRDVIQLLEAQGPLSARETGKELEVTRSTISYRLNRLYQMGLLEKMASGRTIKFRIPKMDRKL